MNKSALIMLASLAATLGEMAEAQAEGIETMSVEDREEGIKNLRRQFLNVKHASSKLVNKRPKADKPATASKKK